jgi:hypothetical protein
MRRSKVKLRLGSFQRCLSCPREWPRPLPLKGTGRGEGHDRPSLETVQLTCAEFNKDGSYTVHFGNESISTCKHASPPPHTHIHM